MTAAEQAVRAHVEAFSRHSTEDVLAGLAPDARWVTGRDAVTGAAALRELFDPWLWGMNPSLTIRSLVADSGWVAAELREELTVEGERRTWNIAGFFTVLDGLIVSATIYREGSADLS